ncbi:GNAT family N-acetyltransferase [Xanthomonas maliensis]|uniref:GNAT family N-acetyltransferase n=1 Tax=Xanthomonas maliensis TaxID=1321368 RepID=UPI00039D0ABD|nr:GNAT family N-acetyltransferase [Xanthomonas maliensis]KAB7767258.1 GNAT family N-acetyltransferase [Xanthomonas maliensis]
MRATPTDLHWQCLTFAELSTAQLYALLQLRSAVFVVEQRCAYTELDGKDPLPGVAHLLGSTADGSLIAYLRVLPPGLVAPEPAIGRVVIANRQRGGGLGHRLMCEGLRQVQARWPDTAIQLDAQAHLQTFYAAHGFASSSAPHLEDGIPHITMRRAAARAPEEPAA